MNSITQNGTSEFSCEFTVLGDYDITISIISAILALFGLVYTYFGYRCFKAILFLSGLIFGGTIVYMLCHEQTLFQETVSHDVAIGISVGIGVLCGFIAMLVKYIGLFLQGFFLGVLLAFGGILALQSFYHPSTPWIPGGILFGSGIICSLLTLKFQKRLIIISTAVYGSYLITACLDYFLEKFQLLNYAWQALMASPAISLCWYSWVILGIWPVLSFSGILLQWKVTAKGHDHTDVIIPRGRRKHVRTHFVRSQRPQQSSSTQGRRSSNTRSTRSASSNRRVQHAPAQPVQLPPISTARSTTSQNFAADQEGEAPPPSYYECVHLGVGEPLTDSWDSSRDHDHLHVTEASSGTALLQSDLERQMSSGQGYVIGSDQASGGYVANSRSRSSQAQRRSAPTHEPIERYAEEPRSKPYRRPNNPKSSRGARRQVAPSTSRGGEASQRLLAESSRPVGNQETISAHAQRVVAVLNRQSAQVQTTSQQSSAAPSMM